MKPEWIIFDVGGVFLDWHACRDATLELLQIDLETLSPVFSKYIKQIELGEYTPQVGFGYILRDLNIDKDPEAVLAFWIDHLKPILPTFDLIDKLSRQYKLGVCTNNWIGILDINKSVFPEAFKSFSFCVDSSAVKIRKPDTAIYKIVEQQAGSEGNKIFFIDDTAENIEAAKQYGWQTFQFNPKINNGQESCLELENILLNSK